MSQERDLYTNIDRSEWLNTIVSRSKNMIYSMFTVLMWVDVLNFFFNKLHR